MDITQLTAFLAWCTAINFVLLILATIALVSLSGVVTRVHGALFGLPGIILHEQYFQYLAQYKILIIMFNLVPYLALRIMAA